jgi:hypothetical protein
MDIIHDPFQNVKSPIMTEAFEEGDIGFVRDAVGMRCGDEVSAECVGCGTEAFFFGGIVVWRWEEGSEFGFVRVKSYTEEGVC